MNNNISNIGTFVSEHPEKKVQNLARYLSEDNLKRAFFKLNKRKAIGIDGVTANDYMRDLDANIHNLYERLVHMTYKPLPSRRVYIPKPGSNKKRPLGIPCLEDKIVQHVMAEILNEIYEQMFINESYGFRPKRNCHQAVTYLRNMIVTRKVNYIVDADIKGFFDNVNHEWLMKFLRND
ncbi:reverse transcriptase domain-containing protein, partial [Holdemanella biformis]